MEPINLNSKEMCQEVATDITALYCNEPKLL